MISSYGLSGPAPIPLVEQAMGIIMPTRAEQVAKNYSRNLPSEKAMAKVAEVITSQHGEWISTADVAKQTSLSKCTVSHALSIFRDQRKCLESKVGGGRNMYWRKLRHAKMVIA